MPSLHGLSVERYLRDPALKQQFVTPMFDIIAPRYDEFTRVFSFGMDRRWKAELLAELSPYLARDATALDLACGTGDLAFALASRASRGDVTGIDASARMIDAAERRMIDAAKDRATAAPTGAGVATATIRFEVGDMTALDASDASVDVVTAGYALRNVPDFRTALGEIARVLKPGGRLFTLDFYRPTSPIWRRAFLAYLSAAGNTVGWLWHREPVVYGYIAHSVDHFVSIDAFTAALAETGFLVEHVHRKLFGGIAIHHARRA